jgi:hypothetical protein
VTKVTEERLAKTLPRRYDVDMNLLHIITDITTPLLEDINYSMGWEFGYELSLGEDDIDEGWFALPIRTDDFLQTFCEAMGYQNSEDMHRQHLEHLAYLHL